MSTEQQGVGAGGRGVLVSLEGHWMDAEKSLGICGLDTKVKLSEDKRSLVIETRNCVQRFFHNIGNKDKHDRDWGVLTASKFTVGLSQWTNKSEAVENCYREIHGQHWSVSKKFLDHVIRQVGQDAFENLSQESLNRSPTPPPAASRAPTPIPTQPSPPLVIHEEFRSIHHEGPPIGALSPQVTPPILTPVARGQTPPAVVPPASSVVVTATAVHEARAAMDATPGASSLEVQSENRVVAAIIQNNFFGGALNDILTYPNQEGMKTLTYGDVLAAVREEKALAKDTMGVAKLSVAKLVEKMRTAIEKNLEQLKGIERSVNDIAKVDPTFNPKKILGELERKYSYLKSLSVDSWEEPGEWALWWERSTGYSPTKTPLTRLKLSDLAVHCGRVDRVLAEAEVMRSTSEKDVQAARTASDNWNHVRQEAGAFIAALEKDQQFALANSVAIMVDAEDEMLGNADWKSSGFSLRHVSDRLKNATMRLSTELEAKLAMKENVDFLKQLNEVPANSPAGAKIKMAFVRNIQKDLQARSTEVGRQVLDFKSQCSKSPNFKDYGDAMMKILERNKSKMEGLLKETYTVKDGLLQRTVDKKFEDLSEAQLVHYRNEARQVITEVEGDVEKFMTPFLKAQNTSAALEWVSTQTLNTVSALKSHRSTRVPQLLHIDRMEKALQEQEQFLKELQKLCPKTPQDMDALAIRIGLQTNKLYQMIPICRPELSAMTQLRAAEKAERQGRPMYLTPASKKQLEEIVVKLESQREEARYEKVMGMAEKLHSKLERAGHYALNFELRCLMLKQQTDYMAAIHQDLKPDQTPSFSQKLNDITTALESELVRLREASKKKAPSYADQIAQMKVLSPNEYLDSYEYKKCAALAEQGKADKGEIIEASQQLRRQVNTDLSQLRDQR
ncbi:MAG: hypothetical protein WCF65_09195 [Parachlamydiaceae bacterium]